MVLAAFSEWLRASWLKSSNEMSEMVRWRVSIESLGGFWLTLLLLLFFVKPWRNVVSLFGAIVILQEVGGMSMAVLVKLELCYIVE